MPDFFSLLFVVPSLEPSKGACFVYTSDNPIKGESAVCDFLLFVCPPFCLPSTAYDQSNALLALLREHCATMLDLFQH